MDEWDIHLTQIRDMLNAQLEEGKHYRTRHDETLGLLLEGTLKLTTVLGYSVKLDEPIIEPIPGSVPHVEVEVKGTLIWQESEKSVGKNRGEATTFEFADDPESLAPKERHGLIRTARMVATERMRINSILEYTPARDILTAGDVLF